MEIINVEYKVNLKRAVDYINNVPIKTMATMNNEIPKIRRGTKSVVRAHAPHNRGVYRASFTINNYSKNRWNVGFEVYAKPPHYRLSHLLEGRDDLHPSYAHILKQFRWGGSERTRHGNFGMEVVGTTKRFKHIAPGYEYACEEMISLCNRAIHNALKN